jgi:hypothetical protein
VDGCAAHQLHVEVPLAEDPVRGLAHGGERLRQQVVQGLAVLVALLELVGHAAELFVAHREEVVLDRVDLFGDPLELAKELAFASLQDAV